MVAQMPLITLRRKFLEKSSYCVWKRLCNVYCIYCTQSMKSRLPKNMKNYKHACIFFNIPHTNVSLCILLHSIFLLLHSRSAHLCQWIPDIAGLCLTTALKELCGNTAPSNTSVPVMPPEASSSSPVREHWLQHWRRMSPSWFFWKRCWLHFTKKNSV